MSNLVRFQGGSNPNHNQDTSSTGMIDKDLLIIIKKMNKSAQSLKDSSRLLRKVLGLPANRARNILARTFRKVIPNALCEYIPDSIAMFISEELDILDFTENKIRTNVNEAQTTAGEMALTAINQKDDLESARAELAKAISEDWSAKQLRDYLSGKVDLEIDENIETLLDDRHDYLPEEEKQRRKANLLKRLDVGLNNKGELCAVIAKACAIQLDTLDELILTLHDFVSIHRPMKVLRDAGITMNENARAILAANAVVQDIFERSIRTFEAIVEVVPMFDKYAISSADMNRRFINGRKRLEAGLAKLEQGRGRTKLLSAPIIDIDKQESGQSSRNNKATEKTAEVL